MSTLHIFSKPLAHYCNNMLANLISSQDTVLLVSDACYNNMQFKQFSSAIHLLEEDAAARMFVAMNLLLLLYTVWPSVPVQFLLTLFVVF